MGRELKFRAWDKDKKQMLPVSDISFGDDGRALTVVFQTAPKGKYYRGLVDGENGILMQFTGMREKNGRDICEGDILLYHWPSGVGQNTYVATIGYSLHALDDYGDAFAYNGVYFLEQESGMPISGYWHPSVEQLEVIGNIYENPELLKNGGE